MGQDKERRDTSDMQREKWKLKDRRRGSRRHGNFQEVKDQNDKEKGGGIKQGVSSVNLFVCIAEW